MAEFQEVIKQMKRMCAHFSPTCNGCKLSLAKGTDEFCGKEPNDIRSDPALIEAAVMQWAAEHPVVYPTWGEFLYNLYPMMGPSTITDILEFHVPPDLAQKLGIQPKK